MANSIFGYPNIKHYSNNWSAASRRRRIAMRKNQMAPSNQWACVRHIVPGADMNKFMDDDSYRRLVLAHARTAYRRIYGREVPDDLREGYGLPPAKEKAA